MPHFPKPFFKKSRGLWYVEISRRQINLGPDKDAAFRRYHELMARPESQTVSSRSVAALADAFLEWMHHNRSAKTYEWYRYRLERFLQKHPDLLAGDLKPFHVENWANSYGLSVTSRRNYLRSVKRCLKWARRQGYIDHDPIADLEVPSGEHREVAIDDIEFARLLTYVRNDALRDLLIVTWQTGCRPQESLRVEARHVDVANKRWVFSKSEAKMKRCVRVVYLIDEAFLITRRLMLAHPDVGQPIRRGTQGGSCCTHESRSCRAGLCRPAVRPGSVGNDPGSATQHG